MNAEWRKAMLDFATHSAFYILNSAFSDAVCCHELTDFFGMSPADDDMVIANGMLEQIRLQVHL